MKRSWVSSIFVNVADFAAGLQFEIWKIGTDQDGIEKFGAHD